MNLTDQIFAQALLLSGRMETEQEERLKALCKVVSAALCARLKPGLTPEDCKADFIAAASLYALASLNAMKSGTEPDEIRVGEVMVKPGKEDAASRALYNQAQLLILPYLQDRFSFRGV